MKARFGMRRVGVVGVVGLMGVLLLASGCQTSSGPAAGPAASAKPRTFSLSVVADHTDSVVSRTPLMVLDTGKVLALSDTTDTLVLDTVELVVRRIELAQADTSCAPSYAEDGQSRDSMMMGSWGDQMDSWGHDGCQPVKVGPVLVDVPLNGHVKQMFAEQLPVGTYNGVGLEIHSPWPGDSTDAAFLAQYPQFDSVSVRVVGTFDDSAFTYTHRIEARQAYRLNPPLVVSDTTSQNLTLRVGVGSWFVSWEGKLVDPRTAAEGGANERLVAWNIFRSLWTFRDDNRDGRRDGMGDGGGGD